VEYENYGVDLVKKNPRSLSFAILWRT